MNKKALSLAICLAMAIPTASNALSLGEIESRSSLNQPFQGKINLLSTTAAEAKNLRVRVASPDVFNRVGIDRPAFLNSIRFQTTVQNGKPVILVSSNQPINEPFLNFLLEVSWPNGQLLKEYTVLLDPPVLSRPDTAIASNNAGVRAEPIAQGRINRPTPQQLQQQRQAQQQARQAQVARQAQAQRQANAQRQASADAARRVATAPQNNTYKVRRGDTLSKIANKLGYNGVRDEQMMVALFEKNRRAFSKSNMNNLKAGVLMTRPSLQEARSLNPGAAKSQIIAQARSWKENRAEQLAKKAGTEKVASAESARMEVMGNTGTSDASGSSSAGDASVAGLNKQLAMLTESLTTKTKENEELKSRITELESLLRKKNRLITLKSEQLASLQGGLSGANTESAEATETPETAVVETAETEVVNNQAETAAPETTVANEGNDIQQQVAGSLANENGEIIRTPDESIVNQAPVIEEAPQEEPKAPVSAFKEETAEESFDIMSLLGSPAAMGIGGGSLLALLGGLWYMRRRKSNDDEVEDFSDFIDDGLQQTTTHEDVSDEITDDMIDESEFVSHDEKKSADETPLSEESANELDDLIQEADVYIVYGLHDQAEAEIKRAIVTYPDNAALHAKLLENYKAAGDKEAFEQATKAFLDLKANDKQNYWDEICEWGNALLPESKLYNSDALKGVAGAAAASGVAMVAGTAVAAASEEADDVIEDSIEESFDDVTDELDDPVADATVDEYEKIDLDEDLEDFDIDDILGAEDKSESVQGFVETDNAEIDDDDFSFDFDDDDLEDEISAVADIDDDEFALDDDSLDALLDADDFTPKSDKDDDNIDLDEDSLDALLDAEDFTPKSDKDHDVANLSLALDSDDFDMIMPEDHAYKSTKADQDDELDEDNLLADFDDNLSFLDLEDDSEVIEETQIETKIDLAKAYIDMGDIDGARSTLEEVLEAGNEDQKRQAEELLQNHA